MYILSISRTLFAWSISVVLVRTAQKSHFIQLKIVSAGQNVFIFVPLMMLANGFILHNDIIGGFDHKERTFDFKSISYMITLGIFGFIALSLNVIGFQYADATKVAWLEYVIIIFGNCQLP